MSASPDDVGLLSKAAAWVAGTAMALVGLVWGDMRRRVSQGEQKIENKADKTDMIRQRDDIAGIYDRLGRVEVSTARIEEQILHVSQDIASEKQTRTETNREISQKLDRIIENRRKGD